MRTKQIALILYVLCCLLAVFAMIAKNDMLMLLAKPAIIPAILYYYLASKTTKVNWILFLVLMLNFIGDTIVLLEINDQTLIIMIPYFFSYLLLLGFVLKDVRKMKFLLSGVCIASLIFCFLMYVLYQLIQMFEDTNPELIIPVLIYGIVLAILGCIIAYCYYAKVTAFTFYMLMFALTSIVSDVFYMLFNFIFQISFLNYFEFAAQLFSYYFLVKYFVLRRNYSHYN